MKGWSVFAYIRVEANPFIHRGIKSWGTNLHILPGPHILWPGEQHNHNIYLSTTSQPLCRKQIPICNKVRWLTRGRAVILHFKTWNVQYRSFATFQQHENIENLANDRQCVYFQIVWNRGWNEKPEAGASTWTCRITKQHRASSAAPPQATGLHFPKLLADKMWCTLCLHSSRLLNRWDVQEVTFLSKMHIPEIYNQSSQCNHPRHAAPDSLH